MLLSLSLRSNKAMSQCYYIYLFLLPGDDHSNQLSCSVKAEVVGLLNTNETWTNINALEVLINLSKSKLTSKKCCLQSPGLLAMRYKIQKSSWREHVLSLPTPLGRILLITWREHWTLIAVCFWTSGFCRRSLLWSYCAIPLEANSSVS